MKSEILLVYRWCNDSCWGSLTDTLGRPLKFAMCTHMRDHKNAIKGPFFEDEHDSQESQKGLESTCFQEKGLFFSLFHFKFILLRGYFQTKSCLGGKIWLQTHAKFVFRGVFPKKWQIFITVYFESPCHACVHIITLSAPAKKKKTPDTHFVFSCYNKANDIFCSYFRAMMAYLCLDVSWDRDLVSWSIFSYWGGWWG